ncbi:hypothetical protein SM68_04538, partial [Klebsiella pneumoniae]
SEVASSICLRIPLHAFYLEKKAELNA